VTVADFVISIPHWSKCYWS